MVFIGVNAWEEGFKKGKVININSKYIKMVNEADMTITLDDGTKYRIDDESLDIFLAAIYGEGD